MRLGLFRVPVMAALLALLPAMTPSLKAQTEPPAAPEAAPITTRFLAIANGVPGVLYTPVNPGPKAATAVLIMHSSADYLRFSGCTELSRRGYQVLCVNNSTSKSGVANEGMLDQVLLELKAAMLVLRAQPGVRRVVLLGHSGGGTVMSAYQMIAEGGVKTCQGAEKIWKCPDTLAGLPPADALMLIDSNWGLAAMTLFSIDPAITRADAGQPLNPALDLFNPANGFTPTGSHYRPTFIRRFLGAEGQRNNALLARAQRQWTEITTGKGDYTDDAPFSVPGAVLLGGNNKLFAQDTGLMAHTEGAYPLLHADGSVTTQIVPSVRVPENARSLSPSYLRGALKTTLRGYLSSYAIRVTADFGYDATSVRGVAWTSSYASPPGNVQGVHVPLLVMGMTGHWEYLAAETIYRLAASRDKTIAFVEGASHLYTPCQPCERHPGAFGDTEKITYDYIDRWLNTPGGS